MLDASTSFYQLSQWTSVVATGRHFYPGEMEECGG